MLGALAFISNGFLPSPIDKMVIGVQALCFSLAALLVPKGGATYASFVTGLLLSALRPGLFPFSLLFTVLYGLLIDGFFFFFKVSGATGVRSGWLVLLLTVATGIAGVVSMFMTTMIGLIPMMPVMYFAIIVVAVINGAVAGYLTVVIWNKYLSNLFN